MNRILAGKIVKPHGIKGEVKLLPYVDAPEGFEGVKSVIIGEKVYTVTRSRVNGNEIILFLEGIIDRNGAEELRGADVYVDKLYATALKRGDYFIDELIGLDAYVESEHIGCVKDIISNRSADIIVIDGRKTIMVPFLKKAVSVINLDENRIVFLSKVFKEIAYED